MRIDFLYLAILLKDVIEWINHTQFLNPASILLSVGSIALSIYFYFKSKRNKKPFFAIKSTNIISDTFQSIGDVKVFYKGDEIQNLTVSKIAVWNDGNETVNYTDLASTDFLRIEPADGVSIFNAELIFESTKTNNLSILISDSSVFILFDYLDKGQGGIVKVIHSGKKSSGLNIKGTFKGIGVIEKAIVSSPSVSLPSFSRNGETRARIPFKVFTIGIMVISFGMIIVSQFFIEGSEKWPILIVSIIYGSLSATLLLLGKSLPRSFKIFYDE